jgi:5-(aminomethyl)-3-furanmethanol phosphate kinase
LSGLPRLVVKLGGSLAGDPSLARWLDALHDGRLARFVVVPGGGPFADAVRTAQAACGFDDATAHRMALLAMDQFGHLLAALRSYVLPCPRIEQFEAAWNAGRLPVWLPAQVLDAEAGLERNWSVTSDTIAAWLAWRIGAGGLILVKSCDLPSARGDAAALASAGIVDAALPGFIGRFGIPLDTLQRSQWCEVDIALRAGPWRL